MNILQILPTLDIGGVETGTIDLARYLARNGHRAIVVSGGGRLVKELEAMGARHYALPVGKKSVFHIIRCVDALCDIIRSEDIDIVHARSRVPAIIGYIACKRTGRVFITTAHGYYKKHMLSRAMGWGKYVIVASNIMARHMAEDFGVPHSRIRLIPRGVDLKQFYFREPKAGPSKEFTVGMVSRITPLKGHADFIKAVSLLRRRIPGIRAVIVGQAPKDKYREDLEILVRRLGLSKTVEFAGARADVPQVMRGLDCLVSATTTPEAFGRVIIEAQASGVPVVATRVGGVVDIVEDGRTGLLCAAGDPRQMADRIFAVYSDAKAQTAMAIAARKRVETDYNLDKMMKATLALYEEALRRRNILVIKLSALGDVILSVPSLRAIRAKYPHAVIKVLIGLQSREALDNCPYINDRIVYDLKGRHGGVRGLWRIAALLQKECFDIVFDLQNNKKSHCLAALSMAPLRYGYDNGKFSFFLNRKIADDAPHLNPVEHQFRVLKLAGVREAGTQLELWPSEHDDAQVAKFLADNWIKPGTALVGINVRASARWTSKNWPPQHIAELCDRLAREYGARTVLTGTQADAAYAEAIANLAKSKPVVAAGKTDIMELASLMKHCKVYITPDSAPMHVAAGMGTSLVALFGPTDPARHLPPSERCVVLCKGAEMKCGPCYSPNCSKKQACMRRITVDDVFGAVKGFLSKEMPRTFSSEARLQKEGAG